MHSSILAHASAMAAVAQIHGHVHHVATPTLPVVLCQWQYDWTILLPLAICLAIYMTGCVRLRRRHMTRFDRSRLLFFLAAMGVLYLALQSPIDFLGDHYLLFAHMVQHVLLWFMFPVLVWLAEPILPFTFGLPKAVHHYVLTPLKRSRLVHGFFTRITHPAWAWPVFVGVIWIWHFPPLFDAALHFQAVHDLEHLCFAVAGLIFWWPVMRPYPARTAWTPWLLMPYLLLAAFESAVLAIIFVFSPHPLYPYYQHVPQIIPGVTSLLDQRLAGLVMWFLDTIVYLIAMMWTLANLLLERGGLEDRSAGVHHRQQQHQQRASHGTRSTD